MSNDIVPQEGAPNPTSSGVQVLQKIGVLSAKAALSSIPWAALVFDVGQTAVEFGYARQTERLLTSIGDRIDMLENGARARLKVDEAYQLSVQAAIRRMLMETNPRMADALARAVTELGASTLLPTERLEIARALDALTEPSLHLLQTMYRAQNDHLTQQELSVIEDDVRKPYNFTKLMYATMQLTSWIAAANELERAGMVVATLDDGWYDPAERKVEEPLGLTVHLREIYPLGERVVRMCFDDPAIPAFGIHAVE